MNIRYQFVRIVVPCCFKSEDNLKQPFCHKETITMQLVYETMYILRSDLGEEQVEQAIKYQTCSGNRG